MSNLLFVLEETNPPPMFHVAILIEVMFSCYDYLLANALITSIPGTQIVAAPVRSAW